MPVTLVRIDDRLIHGQIVHAWLSYSQGNTILIADDFAAKDPTQQLMLKLVAPKTIKLVIKNIEEAVVYIREHEEENIFVIVRNTKSMLDLLENGLEVNYVNLGNISNSKSATGRKTLLKNIHVNEIDVECINTIAKKGVKIEIQLVPDDKPIDAVELIKKNY
ncbi:MAG: PTS system mannose/fructose/N-acetylgalactosamine-transporter subunit IIB [Erysipelotrichaceae bacterium]|jgi:mannose/fructose/N-acetylgalactosamine-specific phosphotransferase system component IIB